MRTTELTDKQARFIQLRAKGWSYSDIAAELGISKGSCSNWAKRYTAEINRAAAKLKEQETEPLPKATKKKAPRVVDITDKLSFDSNPDDSLIDRYLTLEFKRRQESGELTPKESEGFKQWENISQETGNEARDAYERFIIKSQIEEMVVNRVSKYLEEMNRRLTEVFEQTADIFERYAIMENITIESVTEGYKPILEEIEQYIEKTFEESLPQEERERLQAEIEKEQAAATRPEDITVLDACDGKTKKEITTPSANAKIKNIAFDEAFAAIFSGAITSHLSTINTMVKKPSVDKVTGNATVKFNNGFVLRIENYDRTKREWKVSTNKLLNICTLLLTKNNHYREKNPDAINPTVCFNVTDYMNMLGMTINKDNRKEARARIKRDLDTLSNSSIDWKEKARSKRGEAKAYLNTPILGGSYGIDRQGNVIVTFSRQFAEYLIQDAYLLQFSIPLLKTDERNANTYPLGYKLLMHSSIYHNIEIGTANIISVKKLLEICPDIPTYEKVMQTDRHPERKIRDPLEKALDNIPNFKWHYCNPKGAPLTEEQLADSSYSSFIGSNVYFEFIGAPDQTKQVQAHAEKRARKRKPKSGTKRAAKNKEISEQADKDKG